MEASVARLSLGLVGDELQIDRSGFLTSVPTLWVGTSTRV